MAGAIFVLVRALTYGALFVGIVLVFVPAQLLARAGIVRPPPVGPLQVVGIVIAVLGAMLALWCVLTFAVIGKGTPAPFDPPRQLVVRGPYRYVRNPMYVGAATALAGAALLYQSLQLAAYVVLFLIITQLFVVFYEEPTLRRMFNGDYEAYCRAVARWWPRLRR